MSSDPKRATVHDDDDDDLDDLDDVLDQFTPSKPYNASTLTSAPSSSASPPVSSSLSPPSSTSAAKASPPPVASADDATPEWASEFAESMESFMREITAEFEAGKAGEVGADTEGLGSGLGGLGMGSGDPPKDETPEQKAERLKREESFAAAWEAMLVEGMNGLGVEEGNKGATAPSAKASSSGSIPKPVPPPADDYQARIRATMNKLKESESTLNQSQNQASSDPLEALLAQLGQGGLEGLGEGEGGEEQLQGMLETMMGQLMSKDVLYEPLKELSDKFPAYLTKNAATLSASDKSRYEAQVSCIERLLVIFDAPGYKDDNKEKKEEVLHAMSELQSHGSPPEDLMGPLPPGFSMGADGLPNMGAGGDCVIC